MDDLASGMIDLTINPTHINQLYDGSAQNFPLPPLLYTVAAQTLLAKVVMM